LPPYDPYNQRRSNQNVGDWNKESEHLGKAEVEVVAHISVHTLRAERVYHNFKTLSSTADRNGHHVIRPLDIRRFPSQYGHDGRVVVCIFESPGRNHLSQFVDYGPLWYNLYVVEDNLRSLHAKNFIAEQMPLQTFLEFSIGAAECIEMLHSQQIVHGEIRGDAFHMNKDTNRIRLINLGSGPRTFEHALTSTGWSTISKDLGAKTKFAYMSPEQTGRMPMEPDSRTDVYSLGMLFRTTLLQTPAFEGETPMDIIQAVLGQQLPSVSSVRPDIPEVIGRIIQKATAKAVWERYQSVSGLRHDLVEVRRLLQAGDSARLLNWEIAKKDVCPFFNLPEAMVGRSEEHDAIVEIIDSAFKLRQSSQSQNKQVINHLSRLSEGQFASFDIALTADIASVGADNASSVDETTNSVSVSDVTADNLRAYKSNTGRLRSPAASQRNLSDSPIFGASDSDPKSPEKINSTRPESMSVVDSIIGEGSGSMSGSDAVESMVLYRSNGSIRTKGRCEVITIEGAAGLGKSRLIQSVQVEASRRGYFTSSKFDQAVKTPFGPVLKLLSSLFKQVYSESSMDHVLHQSLKQHVEPVWPTLHKVLSLPKFLLGPELSGRMANQNASLSTGYHKNLVADLGSRDSSPSLSQSNLYSKTLGAQSSWDFLRVGASTKSLPLMNTFLDILRIFTRHKFICFCLDDFHLADEESLELITQIISTRIKMVIILAYRPENISSEKLRRIIDFPGDNGIYTVYNCKSEQILTKI
jgi:serine/threonine protein kinase